MIQLEDDFEFYFVFGLCLIGERVLVHFSDFDDTFQNRQYEMLS